ncbi:MAG: EVE domain-containing protein [Chlamydiota bacterium]
MRYWIMKSEPRSYSIDDFEEEGTTPWEGVRNYQARNFMMRDMRVGDPILFYHSNKPPLGVAGVGKIVSRPYPDWTALDPSSKYFDQRATKDRPIWYLVDVAFEERFNGFVLLKEMRVHPDLQDMLLLKKGMRLSIQPITKKHFDVIVSLGKTL